MKKLLYVLLALAAMGVATSSCGKSAQEVARERRDSAVAAQCHQADSLRRVKAQMLLADSLMDQRIHDMRHHDDSVRRLVRRAARLRNQQKPAK